MAALYQGIQVRGKTDCLCIPIENGHKDFLKDFKTTVRTGNLSYLATAESSTFLRVKNGHKKYHIKTL